MSMPDITKPVSQDSNPFGAGALKAILSRASRSKLIEPAPDENTLHTILQAAVCAPDHGRLQPWRFLIIRGAAREALGELFASVLLDRDPAASEAQLQKERTKPLRAPLLIGVAAKIHPNHKIPEVEQLLSAGAAAMNMLNAIHALGFGGIWRTGPACYDGRVRKALNLTDSDQLIGFLYVGTPIDRSAESKRPDPIDFIEEWTGPAAVTSIVPSS